MKKSLLLAFSLACISMLGATACSARPRSPEAANPIFVDASPLLSTTVEVRGLLRWTFENRNLFPPGTSTDHISSKICLPVLITSDNDALLELAKKKDGHIVTVRGRIVETAPQGMVSVTTCKKVGIEVTSLEWQEILPQRPMHLGTSCRWSSAPLRTTMRFPGQYFDAESGLNYNVNRDYEPDRCSWRSIVTQHIGKGTSTAPMLARK